MEGVDKKHAYLIMAHKVDRILVTLIKMLDDNQNDIYIHFDLKSKDNIELLKDIVTQSKLIFTKRIKVYWSHISQCQAMYILWETAYSQGLYQYYHLISGVDLPIKTKHEIREFFNKHQGQNFIGFSSNLIPDKYNYHYIHPKYHGLNWLQNIIIKFEKTIGVKNDLFSKYTLKRGCNWSSLTEDAVKVLLEKKEEFLKGLHHTNCPDECIIQTILYNSDLKDTIYSIDDEFESCMRLIDWVRGKPYTWTIDDFDEIKVSDKIFARKITSDDSLVDKIFETYNE